jgi:coproporphyrinogen III oxidase-like Fe-S oxidoreductase
MMLEEGTGGEVDEEEAERLEQLKIEAEEKQKEEVIFLIKKNKIKIYRHTYIHIRFCLVLCFFSTFVSIEIYPLSFSLLLLLF